MKEYEFILKFDLPNSEDPAQYIDALYEAGCDDATVGIGQKGKIALDFTREASSAFDAVSSAISDIKKAIPGDRLIEATPDIVGLTDISEIIGCTRQNIQKLVGANRAVFPSPIHEGSMAIWHLYKVLEWFKSRGGYEINDSLIEVSSANMQFNIARQMRDIDPTGQSKINSMAYSL